MTSVYLLFLLAPIVTNLGEFKSLEECERIVKVVSLARHKGIVEDAETFGKNRLLCVQVNK
jgi:hypothetical protein